MSALDRWRRSFDTDLGVRLIQIIDMLRAQEVRKFLSEMLDSCIKSFGLLDAVEMEDVTAASCLASDECIRLLADRAAYTRDMLKAHLDLRFRGWMLDGLSHEELVALLMDGDLGRMGLLEGAANVS